MSSLVTKKSWKKAKIWKNSFAPKRSAWYSSLNERQVDTCTGLGFVALAALFFFGGAFSIDASLTNGAPQFREPVAVAAQSNALTASVTYATQILHVPGAYDDGSAPPTVVPPSYPVSATDAQGALSFVQLFAQSLGETTAAVWQNSIGLTASVFVASVYEMGDEANTVYGIK